MPLLMIMMTMMMNVLMYDENKMSVSINAFSVAWFISSQVPAQG
jgi:hypothetical protein